MTLRLRKEAGGGMVSFSLTEDREGYRTYTVTHLVEVTQGDASLYKPYQVRSVAGLPTIGQTWSSFSGDSEPNPLVICKPGCKVSIHEEKEGDRPLVFRVEHTFTNKPESSDEKHCDAFDVLDPLDEPQKINGRSIRYNIEAAIDMDGNPILNKAFEQFRGPQVEFDANRHSIRVEQNVNDLELPLIYKMLDTVNDDVIWGFPARCVKFSGYTWERKFSGEYAVAGTGTGSGTGTDSVCVVYYTRTLEFDIMLKTDPITGDVTSGFDRLLPNYGTKVLSGHWSALTGNWIDDPIEGYVGTPNPDPSNPTHFVRYRDRHGDYGRILLDEAGQPADVLAGTAGGSPTGSALIIPLKYYQESNFLILDLLTDF